MESNFLKKRAKVWIEDGSAWEDGDLPGILGDAQLRFKNHFFDPTTGKGLDCKSSDAGCLSLGSSYPSLQWGKDHYENDYNWEMARWYFKYALISPEKYQRDARFAELFRTLGQIMHLVQDTSVPAHVRNDAHGMAFINKHDMYEKYTNSGGVRIEKEDEYSAVYPDEKNSFNRLDKFWKNDGMGLAEFTNRNFVSRDTNFDTEDYKNYNTPLKTGMTEVIKETVGEEPDLEEVNVRYLTGQVEDKYRSAKSGAITRLSAYSWWDFEMNQWGMETGKGYAEVYSLNNRVHAEYAQFLIPRAVGYSAGLLNYFFRGQIDLEKDKENAGKYQVINRSKEAMDGTCTLYYDDESNTRIAVPGTEEWPCNIAAASGGIPGKSAPLSFTAPTSPKPKKAGKYMLVFNGKLGEEGNAVTGKEVTLGSGWSYLLIK